MLHQLLATCDFFIWIKMSHFQPSDLYRNFKAICLLSLLVGTCFTIKTLSLANVESFRGRGLTSQSQRDEINSFERGDQNSASKKDGTAEDHKITDSTRKSILDQLLPQDKHVLPNNGSEGIHWKTNLQQVARPIILFSVPPKCGSRTLLLVVSSLKTQNNSFQDVKTLVDFNIVEKGSVSRKVQYINGAIDQAKAPAFLYTHAFYVPYAPSMAESDAVEKTLVRISIVRDPMERKISHYYYSRFRDSEPETKEEQVWRSHLKGIRQESFDDCLRLRRPECVAEKFHIRLISQFCGYEKGCGKKSKFALERAKFNVENNFLLVGLMEEYDDFIRVLSKMLPSMFGGSVEIYNDIMKSYRQSSMKTQKKQKPSNEIVTKMRKMMKLDYEFYNYLKDRFREQKNFYLGS